MRKLTSKEKIIITKFASQGKGLQVIADTLGLTGHQAYTSDDFAIAFANGRDKLSAYDFENEVCKICRVPRYRCSC